MSGVSYTMFDIAAATLTAAAAIGCAAGKAMLKTAVCLGKAGYRGGKALAEAYARKKAEENASCSFLESLIEEERALESQICTAEKTLRESCERQAAENNAAAASAEEKLEAFFHQAHSIHSNSTAQFKEKMTALLREEKTKLTFSDNKKSVTPSEAVALKSEVSCILGTLAAYLPESAYLVFKENVDRALRISDAVYAYTDLQNIRMRALETFTAYQIRRHELDVYRNDCLLRLDALSNKLESLHEIAFDYKHTVYLDSPCYYCPELYKGIAANINHLRSCTMAENLSFPDYENIKRKIADAEHDFTNFVEYSMNRMYGSYEMNDKAEMITRHLEDNGFIFTGSANEGGREGEPLHLTFENSVSGEKLALVINQSAEKLGLWVHQYGGSSDGHEQQRIEETNRILEKKFGKRMQCITPGRVSADYRAGNLDAIK